MELLMLVAGLAAGFVVGALYACRKLAGKEAMAEAAKAVVLGGPGPWRPPK